MPVPVSATLRQTNQPARASGLRWISVSAIFRAAVAMVNSPSRGMASRAFTARFRRICSIMPKSPFTAGSSGAALNSSAMGAPRSRVSICVMPWTTVFRFGSCACICCLRLNASSWRVKLAARLAAALTCFNDSSASLPSTIAPRIMSVCPWMTARMLLKSWATPAASWPIDSIFCNWRSCSSSCLRSVMSMRIPIEPLTLPWLSTISIELSATHRFRPSRVRMTQSLCQCLIAPDRVRRTASSRANPAASPRMMVSCVMLLQSRGVISWAE